MRKVFLDNLPRKEGIGMNKGKMIVDWSKSAGYTVRFVHDDIEGEIEIVNYNKKNRELTILFNDHEYHIANNALYAGKICRIIGKRTGGFKYNINDTIFDNKRDLIIVDREYREITKKDFTKENEKWYKYSCLRCGNIDWIKEGNLNAGNGCNACCKFNSKAKLGINTIWDTDRWMCDLGVSEEVAKSSLPQSSKKIEVTCPDCGKKKKIAICNITKYKSICCNCGDGNSYLSKYIISMLDQLEVNYKTEVKYEWNKYINPLTNKESQASIDFVIYKDGREIPLEADGGFHRQYNNMTGMTAEMQQSIDKQRDDNCLQYLNEETIRISDEGEIRENILNSKLAELFDLSNIDWNKCEEFALKNIVKEVCEYWNNKEEWETTQTIADNNKWGIKGVSTIKNYLKKGKKLGWANYDPKEEYKKGIRKLNKTGKAVEIFNNDVSLGIFESCAELERQSEKLFGVKLSSKSISAVCTGKMGNYKGFAFKYTN